ncbi:MAG: MFS transporter, partial [Algoriphagus sp.]
MLKLLQELNRVALIKATVAALAVILLVFIGSRNLQNFDAALVAYLLGTIFAVFGIAYRYSVWLQRPPTRLYWRRSMQFLFSKDFPFYIKRSVT